MATARMISRDFFTSGDLTDLPAAARLLFAGMIVYADDAGIIRHSVGFYRHTILQGLRTSAARIEHIVGIFVARRMLVRCTLEGVSCYRITNFAQFQRLKRREGKRREEKVSEGVAPVPVVSAAAELRLEGRYNPVTFSLLDALGKFARCSPAKAEALYLRLREPKPESFAAWEQFAAKQGKPAAIGAMQNFDHPSEVPLEPGHADTSKGKTTDERIAAVVKRYPRTKNKDLVDPESMAEVLGDLRKKLNQ